MLREQRLSRKPGAAAICRLLGSISQRDRRRIWRDNDLGATTVHKASEVGVIECEHRVCAGLLCGNQMNSVKYHPRCERSRSTSYECRAVDSLGRSQKRQHSTQPPYGSPRGEWSDPRRHRESGQHRPGLGHRMPTREAFQTPGLDSLKPAVRASVVTMTGHNRRHEYGRVESDSHAPPCPKSSRRSSRSRRWSSSSSISAPSSAPNISSLPSARNRESCATAVCAASSSWASSIESRSAGTLRNGVRMITSAGPAGRSSGSLNSTRWFAGMVMESFAAACIVPRSYHRPHAEPTARRQLHGHQAGGSRQIHPRETLAASPSSKVEPSSQPVLPPRADGDANHLPQPTPRSAPILEEDPDSKGVRTGKPLFSCGRENFAWGRTAYGHVLDDQGRIWFYDLGKTWSPRPAGDGLYLETGLRERFRNPVLQSRRVPSAQLATTREKARVARDGQIEKKFVAFESGAAGCEAYLWERSDAYRNVELGSNGDQEIRNSSPEAGQLQEWLKGELGMGTHPRPRRNDGSEGIHEAAQPPEWIRCRFATRLIRALDI